MSDATALEKCLGYIDVQMQSPRSLRERERAVQPAVTISRQAGAGGIPIAEKLGEFLQRELPGPVCPWTVFHRNLVEKVLEAHRLSSRLAQFMPEDRVSAVQDAVEELLGLHPAASVLVQQTTETILKLVGLGYVIIVGRAGNLIAAGRKNVFHVRLVGTVERRTRRIQEYLKLGAKAAAADVAKEDAARRRYVRRFFRQSIDDPLLYHLVINTDRMPEEETAELIGRAVLARFAMAKGSTASLQPAR